MSDLRPTTGKFRRGLKAVVRRLLEMSGGVTSFEQVTRVKAPALSKYGSPDDEMHMPLDVAVDLMMDTGSNGILSFIAAELGYKLVALDAQHFDGDLPSIDDVAQVISSLNAVVQEYAQVSKDGRVTPAERRRVFNEIEKAVQKLRSFQRMVDAATTGGEE
ncbi:phage regulatory CII family protein [Pseudochrobactrum saccharolyticum]|uniref:phage regulatory CII family protein n=1 Tax=Pseudochrobactrum saccharolyticum TaxID=354352 RepID=UPI00277723E7|nr:phage regulatory CII family protein [Pseudochrobactrum saccharolyticum]MDP8249600.1 hypothetical protein [Pseudochrobactrum saccharolyticum]